MTNNLHALILKAIKVNEQAAAICRAREDNAAARDALFHAEKQPGVIWSPSPEYKALDDKQKENDKTADLLKIETDIIYASISREMTVLYQAWAKDNAAAPWWYKKTKNALNAYLSEAAGFEVYTTNSYNSIEAHIITDPAARYNTMSIDYIGYLKSEWTGQADSYYIEYNEKLIIHKAIQASETKKAAAAAYKKIAKAAATVNAARKLVRELSASLGEDMGLYYYTVSNYNKPDKSLNTITY